MNEYGEYVAQGLFFALSVLVIAFIYAKAAEAWREHLNRKYTFELYQARDELALMVCSGKLCEDSIEYDGFIDVINYHIAEMETITFMSKVTAIVRANKTLEFTRKISLENRPELSKIAANVLNTTSKIVRLNSWFEIFIVGKAMKWFGASENQGRVTQGAVAPLNADNAIKEEISRISKYSHNNSAVAA